ncbi:hypothetical protein psal_cds_710 [Pandoravirus salinus]|uniref:Uncharacterized protein n=1 Tax=Pandoravirus salinus TaxID=1349410 RepID=A0A291ATV3_9VIRU|nr:hypothetical protein psal_cds_710 [Pandoravirus salinus]ATE82219.1 hypothetical protein psal_cds_710 [Pandoravirus salinus]
MGRRGCSRGTQKRTRRGPILCDKEKRPGGGRLVGAQELRVRPAVPSRSTLCRRFVARKHNRLFFWRSAAFETRCQCKKGGKKKHTQGRARRSAKAVCSCKKKEKYY